jgi:uncharacterized protein (DUF736 family)
MDRFIITKNKFKQNENQPDYRVQVKDNDMWFDVGGAWISESEDSEGNTQKYFSCKLNDKEFTRKDGTVVPVFKLMKQASQTPAQTESTDVQGGDFPF